MALGQFEPIEDHLRALRDISEILNPGTGVVVHEAVADGSIWFGKRLAPHRIPTAAISYDFNTDETVKFPSAVALVWRWTGDNAFRDEMYSFAKRNLQYVAANLDDDHDGWPEGLGNVERSGMGEEKLDNTVYFIRGLSDLADMARSKHDGRTYAWAKNLSRKLQSAVRLDLVVPGRAAVRRLAGRPGRPAGLPEALDRPDPDGGGADGDAAARPPRARAVRPREHRARRARGPLLQRRAPVQPGPLPHRLRRRPDGPGREGRSSA